MLLFFSFLFAWIQYVIQPLIPSACVRAFAVITFGSRCFFIVLYPHLNSQFAYCYERALGIFFFLWELFKIYWKQFEVDARYVLPHTCSFYFSCWWSHLKLDFDVSISFTPKIPKITHNKWIDQHGAGRNLTSLINNEVLLVVYLLIIMLNGSKSLENISEIILRSLKYVAHLFFKMLLFSASLSYVRCMFFWFPSSWNILRRHTINTKSNCLMNISWDFPCVVMCVCVC